MDKDISRRETNKQSDVVVRNRMWGGEKEKAMLIKPSMILLGLNLFYRWP